MMEASLAVWEYLFPQTKILNQSIPTQHLAKEEMARHIHNKDQIVSAKVDHLQ
ncbi:unnamed protein product, partial [Dovyalis caffra]